MLIISILHISSIVHSRIHRLFRICFNTFLSIMAADFNSLLVFVFLLLVCSGRFIFYFIFFSCAVNHVQHADIHLLSINMFLRCNTRPIFEFSASATSLLSSSFSFFVKLLPMLSSRFCLLLLTMINETAIDSRMQCMFPILYNTWCT